MKQVPTLVPATIRSRSSGTAIDNGVCAKFIWSEHT